MKTWKIITVAGVALIAAALLTASAFAYMGGRGFYSPYGTNTGTGSYGAYPGGMMGGGMMGGSGYGTGYGTTTPPTNTGQYGWGCRGGNGYAYAPNTNTGTAITIDAAVNIAKNYAASLTNKDIVVDEVEEYTQNFYVLFKEKSTGIGAFEMLIDKYTGAIYPEMGPNMMWNTKYGMMSGGMMGWTAGTAGPMTVTVEQAKADAQQFLSANYPGTTVGSIDTFYGYYHVDVLSAGTTYGMLSVNGYTGQVWYHTWHGTYIQTVEL
jgi:hypothetical protein